MNRRLLLKKIFLCVFFLSCLFQISAQQNQEEKKIECTAQILTYNAQERPDLQLLYGNVQFSHEGAICYCDTAFFNEKKNTIDAYGKNLVIHINDSVSLYGNHLVYNGTTKTAVITKDTVLLTNGSVSLYTDKLTYNRNEEVAYYNTNGRLEQTDNVLTSVQGWFYTQSKEVFFKENVVLSTPQYTIKSDTLKYNTVSEIAYFLGPTTIESDSNFMFCKYGWYNTFNDVCQFEKDAKLYNNTQCLSADTIWYDRNNDMGIARHRVAISDTTKNVLLLGNYAEYQKERGFAYFTDSAIAVLIDGKDSLFLHGDQIWVSFDSLQSLNYIECYYNVQFYRDDLQGICDSLSYQAKDSVIFMINSPVLWSGENQLIADTVKLFLKGEQISQMHFVGSASVNQDVFLEEQFNQIRGANLFVEFVNNHIDNVFVDANAQCLYYVQEENEELIGIQKSVSAQMRIFFEDNEINIIRLYKKVKGEVYPQELLKEDKLSGFVWLKKYRPLDKTDIFRQDSYHHAVED